MQLNKLVPHLNTVSLLSVVVIDISFMLLRESGHVTCYNRHTHLESQPFNSSSLNRHDRWNSQGTTTSSTEEYDNKQYYSCSNCQRASSWIHSEKSEGRTGSKGHGTVLGLLFLLDALITSPGAGARHQSVYEAATFPTIQENSGIPQKIACICKNG